MRTLAAVHVPHCALRKLGPRQKDLRPGLLPRGCCFTSLTSHHSLTEPASSLPPFSPLPTPHAPRHPLSAPPAAALVVTNRRPYPRAGVGAGGLEQLLLRGS